MPCAVVSHFFIGNSYEVAPEHPVCRLKLDIQCDSVDWCSAGIKSLRVVSEQTHHSNIAAGCRIFRNGMNQSLPAEPAYYVDIWYLGSFKNSFVAEPFNRLICCPVRPFVCKFH